MTHSEKAAALFNKGYNCSQSVLGAFAEDCGLEPEEAFRLASSFGGGCGRLRELCGAVSAMFMVSGLLEGYSDPTDKSLKDAHYARIQHLADEFKAKNGSYICRDILGKKDRESPVSASRSADFFKVRPCLNCVTTACEILDKHIQTTIKSQIAKTNSQQAQE